MRLKAILSKCIPLLQFRRGRLVRFIPALRSRDFELALIYTVAAGDVKSIEVRAAEGEIGDSMVWRRQNRLHSSGLVADLYSHRRGDVKTAVAVNADAVGVALVRGVRDVQPVVALFEL